MPAPARVDDEPCARCGDRGETVRSAEIISENFTGFDAWPYGLRRLCVPCAWAYSSAPPTARTILTITRDRTTQHRSPAAIGKRLRDGPLAGDAAIVLSVERNFHVLPHSQWGRVTFDRFTTDWDENAAHLLRRVRWLRSVGCGPKQLLSPQPPQPFLRSLPVGSWLEVDQAWQELKSWRATPVFLFAAWNLTAPASGVSSYRTPRRPR